jgi:hypothetical protein
MTLKTRPEFMKPLLSQRVSSVCDKSRIRAADGETGGAEPEENQFLSLEVIVARIDGR